MSCASNGEGYYEKNYEDRYHNVEWLQLYPSLQKRWKVSETYKHSRVDRSAYGFATLKNRNEDLNLCRTSPTQPKSGPTFGDLAKAYMKASNMNANRRRNATIHIKEMIAFNPVRDYKAPPADDAIIIPLSAEEIAAIPDAISKPATLATVLFPVLQTGGPAGIGGNSEHLMAQRKLVIMLGASHIGAQGRSAIAPGTAEGGL